jgi:predicted nuclease with TOPRIM domain
MSIKFNNVIPFPKQKVKPSVDELFDELSAKEKELDALDEKMAVIVEQATKLEEQSQRLLDSFLNIKYNGDEDI